MANQKNKSSKTPELDYRLISGFLKILWMDAQTFIKLRRRIVFRFYTEPPDKLTLHGWTNDNDSFPDPPDIQLNISIPSLIPYGNKTYFGNLVLTRNMRRAIRTIIENENFKYVLFVPHDPNSSNAPPVPPGQITYDIVLTNDDPMFLNSNFANRPTNLNLNPSPPRNPQ